jgi:hypothetical protein
MGMIPVPLNFLPTSCVFLGGLPVGTIMDGAPFLNVTPFGLCTSLANPATAAATAAAFGILTPMPCTLALVPPWIAGNPVTMAGTFPMLTNDSQLMCAFGGVINILFPGQINISC